MTIPLNESSIVFDKAVYLPGETVTGQVCFYLPRNIDARLLQIQWMGKAKTNFGILDGNGSKIYYSGNDYLWISKEGENKMPQGTYMFPLSFQLPIDIPPSFSNDHGSVQHSVRLKLNRPNAFDKYVKKELTVSKIFPITTAPKLLKFHRTKMAKRMNVGLGLVGMSVSIPSKTITPGQVFPIKIRLENSSCLKLEVIEVRLLQLQHSHAHTNFITCQYLSSRNCPLSERKQRNTTVSIGEAVEISIQFPTGTQDAVVFGYQVPLGTSPSFKSSLMSVYYQLQFIIGDREWYSYGAPVRFNVGVEVRSEKS